MIDCVDTNEQAHFAPANVARLLCCLADAHIALQACHADDKFRLNGLSSSSSESVLPCPFMFIPLPLGDFRWASGAAIADLYPAGTGHIWEMDVDFYIFQKFSEDGNSRRRHMELTTQCYQIGMQIIEKWGIETKDWARGFAIVNAQAAMVSEFANTERWAKNLCGYLFRLTLQGVPAVDRCDQFFRPEPLACFCQPAVLPDPPPLPPLCCSFDIQIVTNEQAGRPYPPFEPGYLTTIVTFDDPECEYDPATLFYTWTAFPDVGEPYNPYTPAVGQVGNLDWDGGTEYQVEAWVVGQEDCRAISERIRPPIENPCCDALTATIQQFGPLVSLSPDFDPFSLECRDQISRYIIRRDGVVVLDSPDVNGLDPAPPGEYQGEIWLSSGCIKQSNSIVVE